MGMRLSTRLGFIARSTAWPQFYIEVIFTGIVFRVELIFIVRLEVLQLNAPGLAEFCGSVPDWRIFRLDVWWFIVKTEPGSWSLLPHEQARMPGLTGQSRDYLMFARVVSARAPSRLRSACLCEPARDTSSTRE